MFIALTIVKIISLSIGITYGFSNITKIVHGLVNKISYRISSGQVVLMSLGFSAFVVLQWCI